MIEYIYTLSKINISIYNKREKKKGKYNALLFFFINIV